LKLDDEDRDLKEGIKNNLDYGFTLKIREDRVSHSNSQKIEIFISKTQNYH